MQVAPSTYHAAKTRPPSARARRDARLKAVIVELFAANYSVYGARKMWKALRRAGHDVGRDQTARLMRELGLQGARRGRRWRTTKPDARAGRPPDLVDRHFDPTEPNRLWVLDIERHEALPNRAVVKGHGHRPVAACRLKLRAA